MTKVAAGIAGLALIALSACQKPAETAAGTTAAPAVTTPGMPDATPTPVPVQPAAASLGTSADATSEVKLDVIEAVRAGGIVTIRTRLTLVGGKTGNRAIPGAVTNGIYLSAADKKFMLLKDDADKPLMSTNTYPTFDRIGATATWWGKFPAPGPEVKAVNVYFNDFAPVENIALTDR